MVEILPVVGDPDGAVALEVKPGYQSLQRTVGTTPFVVVEVVLHVVVVRVFAIDSLYGTARI